MLMFLGFAILSVTLWVSSRNLLRAIGAHGKLLQQESEGVQWRLTAINRVLLDSLKPEWWVKLGKMMEEHQKAQEAEWEQWKNQEGSYTMSAEGWRKLWQREAAFIQKVGEMPLHVVDPHIKALVKEAEDEWVRVNRIESFLKGYPGLPAFTEEERRARTEELLRECPDAESEARLPQVGQQHDLILWFQENVRWLAHRRAILQRDLKTSIEKEQSKAGGSHDKTA